MTIHNRRTDDPGHNYSPGFFSRNMYSISASCVVSGIYLTTGRIVEAVVGFAVGIMLTGAIIKMMKL